MRMLLPVEGATIVKTLLVYAPHVVLAVLVAGLYGAVYKQSSLDYATPLTVTR